MSLWSSSCDTEAAYLPLSPDLLPCPLRCPQERRALTLACVTGSRLPVSTPLPFHTLAAHFFLHWEASEI